MVLDRHTQAIWFDSSNRCQQYREIDVHFVHESKVQESKPSWQYYIMFAVKTATDT